MADKKVSIELTATSSQFSAETDKAAAKTRGLADEAKKCGVSLSSSFAEAESQSTSSFRKMGGDVDSYKHKLEELKQLGGRRSALGETLETLKGAGAVAGISILGEELKKCTEKALELSKAFRDGKTDAMGLAVGIAESLPVLGGFVSAGQNIREMLYREKEQIDAINESIKTGNTLMEDRVEVQKGNKKEDSDLADRMTRAKDQLAIEQATTDRQKQAAEAVAKADEQRIADAKDLASVLDGIAARYAKLDKDARDDQEKKRKEAETVAVTPAERRSFWADHPDEAKTAKDSDEIAEMIKRHKIAAIDAVADAQIKADKKEMDARSAAAKATFDTLQALHKQTDDKRASNETAAAAGKADEKVIRDAADWLKEKARALEEYEKKREKVAADEKKHAEEEKKQIQELKAEVSALNSGGDASAAKVATDNPELAKWQAIKDEIIKRNELLKEAETPMDKFKSQLEEIQKMQQHGLLTQEQTNKLAEKYAKDFKAEQNREQKKDADKDAEAKVTGERRFSFDIQSRGNNDKLKTANDHLAEAKRQGNYIMQMWQKITQGDPQLVTIDLLAS